jgi:hypothetical protein
VARRPESGGSGMRRPRRKARLTRADAVERVTRIELA